MELTLSVEEQDFLLNVLQQNQQELLREIARTDSREFRQGLLKDEKLLDSLVCRLRKAAVEGARG
jgi:hypothetical protein